MTRSDTVGRRNILKIAMRSKVTGQAAQVTNCTAQPTGAKNTEGHQGLVQLEIVTGGPKGDKTSSISNAEQISKIETIWATAIY